LRKESRELRRANDEGRSPSDRALRDDFLIEQIRRVHAESQGVYGQLKIWDEPNEGVRVVRCTVERLASWAWVQRRSRRLGAHRHSTALDNAMAQSMISALKRELISRYRLAYAPGSRARPARLQRLVQLASPPPLASAPGEGENQTTGAGADARSLQRAEVSR
jgi:hypothetical protein